MKKYLFLLLILVISFSSNGQHKDFLNRNSISAKDSMTYIQIKTDSLFHSSQIISFLILPKDSFSKYKIEFAYSDPKLRTTSSFGESQNAVAAINGSYFNMDSGGSVTYLEINDSVISKTRTAESKWNLPSRIINGAIVVTKDSTILLQPAKSDSVYELSKDEAAVMVSGPLLLSNSIKTNLPETKFVTKRHPRTCLCTTDESLIFITIDGRSNTADGMTLLEVQSFLSELGCVDAINLDGGGSTTLWLNDKGVVNFPSDSTGERVVANAILILKK